MKLRRTSPLTSLSTFEDSSTFDASKTQPIAIVKASNFAKDFLRKRKLIEEAERIKMGVSR